MRWIEKLKHRVTHLLPSRSARPTTTAELIGACEVLAARRGLPSAAAIAAGMLSGYAALPREGKKQFLSQLAERFGADKRRLDVAIDAYRKSGNARTIAGLHAASQPRLQHLLQRLNLGAGGTAALVAMRRDVIAYAAELPGLQALDADFVHVFSSWFNVGFLALRLIEWTSPGSILRKVIDYEAVHPIRDWEDLRRRIEPQDRRCYAFFHPQMPGEPLIFVEVALTQGVPDAIATLLAETRQTVPASRATTAVFYSISNCQEGLRGVPFGNDLIKRVIETVAQELPGVKTFVTLSPVPGLADWLAMARKDVMLLTSTEWETLKALDTPAWHENPSDRVRDVMRSVTARYITQARSRSGKLVDPVARFHLGNGARLEQVNFLADTSPTGLRTGLGMMVNYLYDLRYIEHNHQAFSEQNHVPASRSVNRLARPAGALRHESV